MVTRKEIFQTLKQITGKDFSGNKAVNAYIGKGQDSEPINRLYKNFYPHTDTDTALAAAVICANRNLNGGQIPGFRGYFMPPYLQMQAIDNSAWQAKFTLECIKQVTLDTYKQVIQIIDDIKYRKVEV